MLSHQEVQTNVRTKFHDFFTLYTFNLVSFVLTLKNFTWNTYVMSSSPTWAAPPYTWHWLVCKWPIQGVKKIVFLICWRTAFLMALRTFIFCCHSFFIFRWHRSPILSLYRTGGPFGASTWHRLGYWCQRVSLAPLWSMSACSTTDTPPCLATYHYDHP